MEQDIQYISDADYRNLMLDFSPLPTTASFMSAVFSETDPKPTTAELVRDLLE